MNPTIDGRQAAAFERAALAWRMAPHLCPRSLPRASACTAYHRVRPLLRQLGLVAEPSDQASFFRTELARAVREAGPRVLISGASDEGMAEFVTAAVAGGAPAVTVLDRCLTPLLLNEHFALAHGLALSTALADIFAYQPQRPFDIIVTHSFLGQIAPERRGELFRIWHALLRPQGRLITVVRIKAEAEGRRRFSPQAAAALGREARDRLCRSSLQLALDPADFERQTVTYAAEHSSWPVRSLAELCAPLADSGFAIAHAEIRPAKPRVTAISGPAVPSGSEYAEIVAVRR